MVENKGIDFILAFQKRWRFSLILSGLLLALGFTLVAVSLLHRFGNVSFWWSLPLFVGLAFLIFLNENPLKITSESVSRFLNNRFPQLEESSQLVLQPAESLNFLEKIQFRKVESQLGQLPKIAHHHLLWRCAAFLITVFVAWLIFKIPVENKPESLQNKQSAKSAMSENKPEVFPAKVKSLSISITPPAYTRKKVRRQNQFSILAESGAQVIWKVKTTEPIKSLKFIFNDQESISLQATDAEKTSWTLKKTINKPGFYQLSLDGRLSDLYQLEIVKDEPAFVKIIAPKQYSTIDFGQPQKVNLKVSVSDDYGVKNAVIRATMASGKGEGVQFKEQQIRFATNFSGQNRSYNLQKTIDLKALGMIAGDELYFYIIALDNFNQESRSETYFVSIADTAELMSMDGMASGVDLMPEYFRSQRQIIMDTEKLLKERSAISPEDFKNRSNNLGIDQKLLRLRYGKFLGEEGEHEDEDHEGEAEQQAPAFGNADNILHEFGHDHDNAEDATFFEPELKSQLKATLTEMWNSELRLRTYKPAEALPYEYKALRLLKDLQQKSRVYVAKTSSKTPPLKPETRLSGELDKIINPFNQRNADFNTDPLAALMQTPGVLEKLKSGRKINGDDRQILVNANKILSDRAASNPSAFLGAVISLRKIIGNEKHTVEPGEIMVIEKALQKAIPKKPVLPQASMSDVASDLSKQYFKNLKRLKQ